MLEERIGGPVIDSQLTISESSLARLAITIRPPTGKPRKLDARRLQADLKDAATPWTDRVRDRLRETMPEPEALRLHERLSAGFPVAYQEAMTAERAGKDVLVLESLINSDRNLETDFATQSGTIRFSVYQKDQPIALYLANPILEHMGLKVVREDNFAFTLANGKIWIQDFELQADRELDFSAPDFAPRFRECFVRTLKKEVENDGFNALIAVTDLDWREANLLRAYCRYILQTKLRFSQSYMLETLLRYPALARAIVRMFAANFDPGLSSQERARLLQASQTTIQTELDRAVSLDDDRILRAFAAVARATLRNH
jgi:glutamate dehydrogenase